MAQLLLASAGAVVGSFFGPIGTSVGWAIGSMLGASLGPGQTFEQPIADLTVSVGGYGSPIPLRYGRWRGGGLIFWHSPQFRAIRSETTEGGKGGPKVTTVSYSYEIDVAVALNDRETAGCSRVWIDGRLVHDTRAIADLDDLAATTEWCEAMTFYSGSETQEPDPTMEAQIGLGLVPAYRGVCYVLIRGLKCGAQPRLPNLEFEIASGRTEPPTRVLWTDLPAFVPTISGLPYSVHARVLRVQGDTLYINYGNATSSSRYPISVLDGDISGIDDMPDGAFDEPWPSSSPLFDPTFMSGSPDRGLVKNMALVQFSPANIALYFRGSGGVDAIEVRPSLRYGIGTPAGWTVHGPEYTGPDYELIGLLPHPSVPGSMPYGMAGCADRNFFFANYAGYWAIWRIDGAGAFNCVRYGTTDPGAAPFPSYGVGPTAWDGTGAESLRFAGCMESDLTHVWFIKACRVVDGDAEDGVGVQCFEIGADDVLRLLFYEIFGIVNPTSGKALYADAGLAWCLSPRGGTAGITEDDLSVITRLPLHSNDGETLSDVLADLYSRAGRAPGDDLDLSAASATTVRGFEFVGPRAAADAVQVLRSSFFFDIVESDGLGKLVMRGGASSFSVARDELVKLENPGADLTAERRYESEIPAQIVVEYLSEGGDYRRGTQQAQRATTGSQQVRRLTLPVLMTDGEAAAVADVVLRENWRSRSARRFATTRRWAALEPTDVGNVADDAFVYRLRIVSDRRGVDGKVEFDAVDEGGASYTSTAEPGTVAPRPGMEWAGSIRMVVLDVPPLRDGDDGPYQYLAAVAWNGGAVDGMGLRSMDGGANWAVLAPLDSAAAIGVALDALTAGRSDIVDEASTLTVRLIGGGTLASVSYDDLLSGIQAAAIGAPGRWEIVGFGTATASGSDFVLSRFLRGRFGTEDAMARHGIGDLFVLLDAAALERVIIESTDRGRTALYAAVPNGRTLAAAQKESVAVEVRSLVPLAPVHLTSTMQPNGDELIRWVRRARVNAGWRDTIDVPLDEQDERYELEITSERTGVLLRAVQVTAPEYLYTAAAKAADFAGAAPVFVASVAQRSALVGPGVPASAHLGGREYTRNWDNGSLEQQTLVGTGTGPTQRVSAGVLVLRVGTGTDVAVQAFMDWIPQFANGVIEIDLARPQFIYENWVSLRTTYASASARGQCAYAVSIHSNSTWEIVRGTNSASNSRTTLASGPLPGYSGLDRRTLRVEIDGSTIGAWFDGLLLATVTDSTHAGAGRLALGAIGSSDAVDWTFDNLRVRIT